MNTGEFIAWITIMAGGVLAWFGWIAYGAYR